jgi:hypothetical protein
VWNQLIVLKNKRGIFPVKIFKPAQSLSLKKNLALGRRKNTGQNFKQGSFAFSGFSC